MVASTKSQTTRWLTYLHNGRRVQGDVEGTLDVPRAVGIANNLACKKRESK